MIFNPSKNRELSLYQVNNGSGAWLHAMLWLHDDQVGGLPEEYNWLDGHTSPKLTPKIVHYTRGTPDMLGDDLPYADEWREYV